MPEGELQNKIECHFKWIVDFTDYVDHNQHLSCLNARQYISYDAVKIQMMSFQCDK